MSFVNLHTHSQYSFLDSIARPEEIVDFAKKNNQPAVCVSDHGTLTSFIEMQKLCKQNDIKCLMACEIYEVDDEYLKNDTKTNKQPRYHLLLIARNNIGKQNLINIVSHANTTGKYVKPRVSINTIKKNGWGKGIICATACLAGRLSKYLMQEREDDALDFMLDLEEVFDNVYCEIQSKDVPIQANANNLIYKFSQEYGFKYIITSDAHMVDKEDFKYQSMFVKVGTEREVGETYSCCFMQTEEDVYSLLGEQFSHDIIKEGIENTCEVVDLCENINVGLDNENQMPKVKIPPTFASKEEYLRHLVYKEFDSKFGHMSFDEQMIREERIDMELPVLFELEYTDYFIMLYEIANAVREHKIPIGYSRGSGANCLCLYMLNVTQIDSVRWGLDFSRFANLGRKALADFDFDFSKRRRKEVITIAKELYGEENVCAISTFNTFTNKVAIRDIGKVLHTDESSPYYGKIPNELRDEVAKLIPVIKTIEIIDGEECEIEVDIALTESLKGNQALLDVYYKYPIWFEYAIKLSGLPKSRGKHASAIMITPKTVTDYCSVCLDKSGEWLLECDMGCLMDDIKLVKMDFLGLKNLDIIDDTLKMVNLTWDDVDINHLNLDDKEVFDKVYKVGHTVGIFQMESVDARNMLIEAKASNIEDVIVVNSANRPGTKDSFPDYCHNKLHPNDIHVTHSDLNKIFEQSHSVLLYQEQALSLLRYSGFPELEVENARRAISKKHPSDMAKLKPRFTRGLKEKGWNDEQIKEIWELLEKQSTYCFNRGHGVAYGLLSYLTAYLKTHYPLEFITSCLIAESGTSKLSTFLNEAKNLGFKITNPNINKSEYDFVGDKDGNKILYGFNAIKGFSMNSYDVIMANRPFASYKDFMERVGLDIGVSNIVLLIKAGAFNELLGNDKEQLLKMLYSVRFDNRKLGAEYKLPIKTINKTHIKSLLDDGLITPVRANNKGDCLNIINSNRKADGWKIFQDKYMVGDELSWEAETLGVYLSGNPLDGLSIPDWKIVDNEEIGYIAGNILSKRDNVIKKGKNKGKKMSFISIDTPLGVFDMVVFTMARDKYLKQLQVGKCYVYKAYKSGELSGSLQSLISIEEYRNITQSK